METGRSAPQETWFDRVLREARERQAALRAELAQVERVITALARDEEAPQAAAPAVVAPPAPPAPTPPPAPAEPVVDEPVEVPVVRKTEPPAPEPTPEPEPEPEPTPEPAPPEPEPEPEPATTAVSAKAQARDRRVLEFLISHGGAMESSRLRDALKIPKGSWHFILERLEKSGAISIVGDGRKNKRVITAKQRFAPAAPAAPAVKTTQPQPRDPAEGRRATPEEIRSVVEPGETASTKDICRRLDGVGSVQETIAAMEDFARAGRDELGFPTYTRAMEGETATPKPPAPDDDLPPEYRDLPAAKLNIAASSRLKIARVQRAALDAVNAGGDTVVGSDVVEAVQATLGEDIAPARIKDAIKALVDAGKVRETGNFRYSEKQAADKRRSKGRTQREYAPVGSERLRPSEPARAAPAPVQEQREGERTEPSAARASTAQLNITPQTEPKLEWVRDVVHGKAGAFGAAQVVGDRSWPLVVVEHRLQQLADRGTLKVTMDMPDMKLYEYQPPEGPGAAAKVDMTRRESAPATTGSEAVAGTGRPTLPSNDLVRSLVQDLRKQGYTAEPAGSGHWAVTGPNIRRLLISGTPRGSRSVNNDRARLRRMGVPV